MFNNRTKKENINHESVQTKNKANAKSTRKAAVFPVPVLALTRASFPAPCSKENYHISTSYIILKLHNLEYVYISNM